MTDYLYLPTDEEAERIRKELKARGVTHWGASGLENITTWVAEPGSAYYIKDKEIHTRKIKDLNNATLAKIPKLEPCVVIRHEVQEEGVLRLLDELGVRWGGPRWPASRHKPSESTHCIFPYALKLSGDRWLSWTCQIPKNPQSTKDFMEGVKNALL